MLGLILLTGATGYVGGRLSSVLQDRGIRVRCLTRRHKVLNYQLNATTEIVAGDVLDPESLAKALTDVDTAYYFAKSLQRNERDCQVKMARFAERPAIEPCETPFLDQCCHLRVPQTRVASRPHLAIQHAVVDRFVQVLLLDLVGVIEVGDGASDAGGICRGRGPRA